MARLPPCFFRKRRPPASRLRPYLVRWRKIDGNRTEKLRAAGPHEGWRANPVRREPHARWPAARRQDPISLEGILEDAGLGDDVVRHSLRHTAATWLMQAGVDMWEAAGWLGMTVEQLEANYGHHHPDFQEEAAEAFGGRR
jgi:integrase